MRKLVIMILFVIGVLAIGVEPARCIDCDNVFCENRWHCGSKCYCRFDFDRPFEPGVCIPN